MIRPFVATALAVWAGVYAIGAEAQNVVVYGLLDAAASRSRPVGGEYAWQVDSGDMSRSFLGFRGNEDLGGGVRAVFKLESYLRLDTGAFGHDNTDGFWGRDSYAGLQGSFGMTVLGRNVTPLYLSTVNFNPFGESFAFSPSTRQYFAGAVLGDRSWNNSIAYTNSTTNDPLRVNFVANLPEAAPGSPAEGRNYGSSLSYISGPFAATVALEWIKNSALPVPAGFQHQLAMQAGATYDFKFVRLYGQAGRVKTEADTGTRTVLYQIGAAVPVGTGLVLLAYGRSQAHTVYSQITDRTTSIGYDYFLSKNTDVYVTGLYEKTFMLSSGSSVAGGLRLRF
jgi:predicted porin